MTTSPSVKRPRGLPMTTVLPGLIAIMLVFAVVPVLAFSVLGTRENTYRLLGERTTLVMDAMEQRLTGLLDPVAGQLEQVAADVAAGRLDPDNQATMRVALSGVLGLDHVIAVGHILPDLSMRRYRHALNDAEIIDRTLVPSAPAAIDAARTNRQGRWAPPQWSAILGQFLVVRRVPLYRGESFHGTLVGAVTTSALSGALARFGDETDQTPFILIGRDRVLAHPLLANMKPPAPSAQGEPLLPTIEAIGDPVLAHLWTDPIDVTDYFSTMRNVTLHYSYNTGDYWTYAYRPMHRYGETDWLLGTHHPSRDTRRERWVAWAIGIGGSLFFVLALVGSIIIARRLARPFLALADMAEQVERLEFAAPTAPRISRIAEINRATTSIERMRAALQWFEIYLPRQLVRRLMAAGETDMRSEMRDVTVMFTDLEGYTTFARDRAAEEVADYLNALLARIGPLIEETGGTIDKYIGDGVMAFWGAPEPRPDHAVKAVEAARAIAPEVRRFNEGRRAAGKPTCRMRIGLHSGEGLVGNVGFAGRMNYTVTGGVVNIAQRAEQFGRGRFNGDDVIAFASASTCAGLEDRSCATEAGTLSNPGEGEHRVYRLAV